MFKYAMMGALAIAAPDMAAAAGWGWSELGYVTSSTGQKKSETGEVLADYPEVGTEVLMNFYLSDPLEVAEGGETINVWASVAGIGSGGSPFEAWASDYYEIYVDRIHKTANSISFQTPDIYVLDDLTHREQTLYGSFGFTYGPDVTTTPETLEDLYAVFQAGQLFGNFSFSGTQNFESVLFAVGQPIPDPEPAPVPLPASALLLMGGVGGLAALRRKRR